MWYDQLKFTLKSSKHLFLNCLSPERSLSQFHIDTMNFYGGLLCFCDKSNMLSKFSHLCGYKTLFRTERRWRRRATAAGRRGNLKETEGGRQLKV